MPDAPDWVLARAEAAAGRAAHAALPTPDAEVWRYSRIADLDIARFAPVRDGADDQPVFPGLVQSVLDAVGDAAALVVTRDGRLLSAATIHDGVTAVVAAGEDDLGAELPHDGLAEHHAAALRAPLVVRIARGATVEAPVLVVHLVTTEGALAASSLRVVAEENAQAKVVEVFAAPDDRTGAALALPATTLEAGQGARLGYVAVQALAANDWSIAHLASTADRDATLTTLLIALGGTYARVRTDSRLVGRGAEAHLLAVSFGERDQQHDFRTLQDHRAARTTSDLLFKGAWAGSSHGVYSGMIKIDRGAKGTKAFQTNRNLLLSREAHADSVPNLEIDENDVACSHASAVGPVDEQQRFYLEARGVPTEEADRLIVLGFLADVLDRSPVAALAEPLVQVLAEKVSRATAERLSGGVA